MGEEIRLFPPHWLEKYDEHQLERLAIMTVDGNVPDRMAERIVDREKKEK